MFNQQQSMVFYVVLAIIVINRHGMSFKEARLMMILMPCGKYLRILGSPSVLNTVFPVSVASSLLPAASCVCV